MTRRRKRFAVAGALIGLNLYGGNVIIVLHNMKKIGLPIDTSPTLVNITAVIIFAAAGYLIYKLITTDAKNTRKGLASILIMLFLTSLFIGGLISYNHPTSYTYNNFYQGINLATLSTGMAFIVLGLFAKKKRLH